MTLPKSRPRPRTKENQAAYEKRKACEDPLREVAIIKAKYRSPNWIDCKQDRDEVREILNRNKK